MKIANIVYEKELVNHVEVEYINYFKGIHEYDSLDKTLPTLYVGWSFMKACNPSNEIIQNADILRKKIVGNELYWEFSFEESKPSHVKGVESFVNLAPQYYFPPKYNYINLDPVFFQIVDVQDLFDVLPKKIDKYYIFKNSMMYLLSDKKIYGINLDMYRFFKFDIDKMMIELERLTFNGNSENYDCINDLDGTIYQSYYKILPNFTLLKRYLITLL
jgi:hypothetical protein